MAGNATVTIRDYMGNEIVPGANVTIRNEPAPSSDEASQARRAKIQTRREREAERKAAADKLYSRRAELSMQMSELSANLDQARAELAEAVAAGNDAGQARKLVSRYERDLGELQAALDVVNRELARLVPGSTFGGHRVVAG